MTLEEWKRKYADASVTGDALDAALRDAHAADAGAYDRDWRPYLEFLDDDATSAMRELVHPKRGWRATSHSFCVSGKLDELEAVVAARPYARHALGFNSERVKLVTIEKLAKAKVLANVDELDLDSSKLGDKGIVALCNAPLTRVARLRLSECGLTDAGAKTLAGCAALASLRSLDVGSNKLTGAGIQALLKAFGALQALDVSCQDLGGKGAAAFGRVPSKLRQLRASVSDFDDAAIAELAGSAHLASVVELELSGNEIGKAGCAALAKLPALASLSLDGCQIGADGIEALAASTSLRSLSLHAAKLGDAGVAALARSGMALAALYLGNNEITTEGARMLARAPAMTGLRRLALSYNAISDDGVIAIAENLTALESLSIDSAKVGDRGMVALAASPLRETLRELDAGKNALGAVGDTALGELTTAIRERARR